MDYKENPLSQSLIKQFLYRGDERQPVCPYSIYAQYIAKTHKFQTESMQKGSLFETLCLGRGAGGRLTDDLPRKRLTKKQEIENIKRIANGQLPYKGDKTIDHIRIEQQAEKFTELADKYQIMVSSGNTQVRITVPWHKDPNVYLSMEFDIFPTTIMTTEGLKFAVIDLKLTMDINSNFGEYCWGSPEFMDITQAIMYLYGIKHVVKHIDLNPHMRELLTKPAVSLIDKNQIFFYYWVFSYKRLENKLIKVNWDSNKEKELHESINKTISLIEFYEQQGWETKPNYNLCKSCPVKECIERQEIEEI